MSNVILSKTPWAEWSLKSVLENGPFGIVYCAFRVDNKSTNLAAIRHISVPASQEEIEVVVDKGINSDTNSLNVFFDSVSDEYVNEISAICQAKDSNIVLYEDVKKQKKINGIGFDVFIRTELLQSLTEHLKSRVIDDSEIVHIGTDICTAISRCRAKGIIHKEISPSNIFVTDTKNYKLGNFEVSVINPETNQTRQFFYAPELFTDEPVFNEQTEVYALGITLYCLLNNDLYPLITAYSKDDKDAAELSNARRIKGERIPAPANGSRKLQEIVLKAIEYLPENRYKTAEDFKNTLINYNKDTASATKTEALPVTPKREDSEINNNLINIAAPHAQSQTDNDPIVIAPEKSRPDANVQIINESVQNNMSSQISYPQPSYRYPTHSQQVPSGKTNNDLTKYAIIGAIIVIIAIIIASNSNTSNNGDSYIDSSIGASSTFDEYSDDSSESSEDSEDASTDYDTSNIIPVKKTSCSGSAGKGKYGRKYGSDMAVDGKPETCWMAYGTPAGKGSWIRLDFAKTTTIKGIEFINGNTWNGVYKGKFIEGYEELYEKNGRLHDFTLEFSDGTQLSGSADDIKETEYEENIFVFNSPIKTRYVIIYVESGYKGYKYENNVCIGEISVFC